MSENSLERAAANHFAKIMASTQGLPQVSAQVEQEKPPVAHAVAATKTPAELATAYFQGLLASK